MTKLNDFLENVLSQEAATNKGTSFHKKMQFLVVDDSKGIYKGDSDLINEVNSHPELKRYFVSSAKTEVPIAGEVFDKESQTKKFVSMRIDRLLVNDENKSIVFIDYKTDTDKTSFIEHYKSQFDKYTQLLQSAYPGYNVVGYILWKQDWTLNKII